MDEIHDVIRIVSTRPAEQLAVVCRWCRDRSLGDELEQRDEFCDRRRVCLDALVYGQLWMLKQLENLDVIKDYYLTKGEGWMRPEIMIEYVKEEDDGR